jgi:hypothetical protein
MALRELGRQLLTVQHEDRLDLILNIVAGGFVLPQRGAEVT